MPNTTTADSDTKSGIQYKHTFLGEVRVTPACLRMQYKHPDPSTMFVLHNGEIKEVTRVLVHPYPR